MNRYLVLILGLLMALIFPIMALADDDDSTTTQPGTEQVEVQDADEGQDVEEEEIEEELEEEEIEEEDVEEEEEEALKPWIIQKNQVEQEKDAIEDQKDQLEEQKDALEDQLEAAEDSGDKALIESLKTQIADIKTQMAALKVEMKQKIELMHQIMRERYTAEELAQLQLVGESLSSQGDVEVLPVENILAPGNVKFDTPPVIKYGRTLIPCRAISEAMGAQVTWTVGTQTVTIVKDGKEIVLNLAEGTVFVNGTETTIDVKPEIMNNRTMVPLRFIAENLDLKVQWEPESQTVEIEEPETQTDEVEEPETNLMKSNNQRKK